MHKRLLVSLCHGNRSPTALHVFHNHFSTGTKQHSILQLLQNLFNSILLGCHRPQVSLKLTVVRSVGPDGMISLGKSLPECFLHGAHFALQVLLGPSLILQRLLESSHLLLESASIVEALLLELHYVLPQSL